MGGTLDATNVVDPAVSVITTLDWEHVAVLGPGMAEIAANKAGIIKPGRPAVSVRQSPIGEEVIIAAAAQAGSPLLLEGRDWDMSGDWTKFQANGPWGSYDRLNSGLAGDHQMQNAGAAIAALSAARDKLPPVSESAIRTGLASVHWPGRYERVSRPNKPIVVLDGAHTPASADALAATVRRERFGGKVVAVVGMFADKDPGLFLGALAKAGPDIEFVIVPAPSPRSADPGATWARIGAAGYIAPTWPKEYGGLGASPKVGAVIARTLGRYKMPRFDNPVGVDLAGPAILRWGTEEQKQRFVARIARHDDIWCQLFSEPGAGSDLAGLATRAKRDGDTWIVRGQKVWTSLGDVAAFGLLLLLAFSMLWVGALIGLFRFGFSAGPLILGAVGFVRDVGAD